MNNAYIISLLVMTLSFFAGKSYAQDLGGFQIDGIKYNILSEEENTAEVFQCPPSKSGLVKISNLVMSKGRKFEITKIADNAFNYCTKIDSVAILAEKITSIPTSAFEGCDNLRGVSIPMTIQSIETCAFYGCHNLKYLKMPDSLQIIGEMAFDGCPFTSVTIPKNVHSIGEMAFKFCSSLNTVYSMIETPLNFKAAFDDNTRELCTLVIPAGSTEAYRKVGFWGFIEVSALRH